MQPTVVKAERESRDEGFHSAVGYVVTVSIDDVFHMQLTCSPRFRDGRPLETPEGLLLAVALLRLCSEQQPGNKSADSRGEPPVQYISHAPRGD